ncbi:MAG: septum formation initiator family protein [Candidatus Liberibacter ctenarytainae]|uniref:Septum formation initiator family protein n=1 Tax=Candidatus Liberibacter ctenarytainae TaxID=2020335 RepID=A0A937DLH2_9HYPH|nr:septum formation initiator family protein [Candidatus Liberibacter ctenarytainae]
MWTKHYKRNNISLTVFRGIVLSFIVYFTNHAIRGSDGLYATRSLENALSDRLDFLLKLRDSRNKMEHKVKLLSDGSLEKDILDEKARYSLNLSRTDEIVLFYPDL